MRTGCRRGARNQQGIGDLFGAIGMGRGHMPWGSILSDENAKPGRPKVRGILKSVRKMPVDEWSYKPDAAGGDGGATRHVGPMAQEWKEAICTGDGETIPILDAIGVTMGAIKELDRKVTRIARGITKKSA
jgi:hypothetical protein